MNENLDLTKILKGCPEGTEFYSSVFGEVRFIGIDTRNEYPIKLQAYNKYISSLEDLYYTKEGNPTCAYAYEGECTLFPDKNQRDWSKFERFWDKPKKEKFDVNTLQPFDKILARDRDHHIWTCALLSHIDNLNEEYKVITVGSCYMRCIPYNEETKHLVGTLDDCPKYYKWWEK